MAASMNADVESQMRGTAWTAEAAVPLRLPAALSIRSFFSSEQGRVSQINPKPPGPPEQA